MYSWGEALGLNIFTFLILMSALIPISLTVTMEVVKVVHAKVWSIDHDDSSDSYHRFPPEPPKLVVFCCS